MKKGTQYQKELCHDVAAAGQEVLARRLSVALEHGSDDSDGYPAEGF